MQRKEDGKKEERRYILGKFLFVVKILSKKIYDKYL